MVENDLISRQAAIDTLEREKTYSTAYKDGYTQTDYFKQYNMGLTDGIKALSKLPSAQQWIPVTEDKPQKCSNILVTDFNTVVEAYYDSDGNWFDLLGTELKGVTAWMPTPKPYRKETEDERDL